MACCEQVDNGAAVTGSAAPAAAMAPAIPGEPISLLLKESVIVVLQKDGGLENMEVQGTIALQVRPLVWPSPFLSLQPRFLPILW